MNKNLLIVDDSATIALSVKYIFEQNDYCVFHASDGAAGKDLLDKLIESDKKLSLIILDINMPKKNGLELLKEIKSEDKSRFIPVLMLTSESQIDKMSEAKKLGATGYLVKPFHPEQLLSMANNFAR